MPQAIGRSRTRFLAGCLAPLMIAALCSAAGASAAPTVTLRVVPLPIPGLAGTGDILGAAAEVETDVTIGGSEYGGFPSPLTELTFYAPSGVEVDSAGFPTCAPAVLEADGPPGCPRRSRAGSLGEGLGAVSFGGNLVPEKVLITEFFIPDGGLAFYVEGRTPAAFDIIEKGYWTTAGGPFGPKLIAEVPLIETVPGADDASVLSFEVRVGAAYRRGKQTISYITLPKRCPRGGAQVKAQLRFLSGETTTATYRAPCPRHR